MGWLILLMGLAFAQPVTPAEAGDVVDRVVAVVEGTPVTASSVAFETAVRERIAKTDSKPFGRLLTDRSDPLEALIFKQILREQPLAVEVSLEGKLPGLERLRAFERSFDTPEDAGAFRTQWGRSRQDMLEFFQDSAVLDAVIELAVQFRVSEQEERAYFEENKDRVFGGRPYEEVAGFVAQQVYRKKFEGEYNSWRARLRSGAALRYLARE